MNSLARALAGIMFVRIAQGSIDLTKDDLLRILYGRVIRSSVNLADKDEFQRTCS